MTAIARIEDHSTIDEAVDAAVRLSQSTRTYRKAKRQSQWITALSPVVVLIALTVTRDGGADLPTILAIAVPVALVTGFSYGRYHEWYVRNHYRKLLTEMYGGAQSIQCEMELRPDTFWTRQHGIETALPWTRSTKIADGIDGIELWFEQALVIVRGRAFANPRDRQFFLDQAQTLARGAAIEPRPKL